MDKLKTTYAVRSLLEIFLSIWTLIILGLPFCSFELTGYPLKMQALNGYFFFSLIEPKTSLPLTQDMQIFTIIVVVMFSIIIAIAIINIFLNILNFYLKEHPITKSCSIFVSLNCFSSLIYMIASIVFVVIANNASESVYSVETHAYIYFLVSLIILIIYYISPLLIKNNYKKSELKNNVSPQINNQKHPTTRDIASIQLKQTINNTVKPNMNLFNELLKYKELLDNEILTQEEFDKIKLKLFELN